MSTPAEFLAGLVVGTIETVAPDRFTVLLDTEAPQTTALNTGVPTRFPRINGFVLVPGQGGAVVGQVSWLGIERSAFPKRPGLKDFGLVDLPFPLRTMSLTPLGTLRGPTAAAGMPQWTLDRGVAMYPSVGDTVVLPTAEQLRAIVQSGGSDARVEIGRSPLSDDAVIAIDPDKLFGRHVAVLGNTGSGKSCTVAGLVRWSLQAALEATSASPADQRANARFIVLDPNGEYRTAFADLGDVVRVFRVADGAGVGEGVRRLTVPAWMWNAQEWSTFAAAAPRTQQPVLNQALHELRTGQAIDVPPESRARRLANRYRALLRASIAGGPAAFLQFPGSKNVHRLLQRMEQDLEQRAGACEDEELADALRAAISIANETREKRREEVRDRVYEQGFSEADLQGVVEKLDEVVGEAAEERSEVGLRNPDAPVPFELNELPEHLDFLADTEQFSGAAQHVALLTLRIRALLADGRIRPIIDPDEAPTLATWLHTYLGNQGATKGTITVIDFSLVPSDVLHILVSAIGRLVFESLQRHRRLSGDELPTVLVLEEAHSFIHAGSGDPSEVPTPTQLCRRTFERIAREGRKFGLGLVLSSQRPAELSQTVLSQCNTFILHRLVNDRDQEYVRRLVPDLLSDVLAELPSLPSQHAVLLGWASPVPRLVCINDLPLEWRPHSNDPAFWDVWTGVATRPPRWNTVAREWVDPSAPAEEGDETEL